MLRILKSLSEISGNSELAATHFDELLRHKEWFDPELVKLARQHLVAPDTAPSENNVLEQKKIRQNPHSAMVRTASLSEGQRLAADLYSTDGALLLSEGTILSQMQVEKIRTMLQFSKIGESTEVFVPK